MNDDLTAFWSRADLEVPIFTGDEFRHLPKTLRDLLETNVLIRRGESSTVIDCDACGDGHLETVEMLLEPFGSRPRAYINCPEAGRAAVDIARLQQWSVNLDAVARAVAAALDIRERVISIVPSRVWLLGARKFDEHMRDAFLVRGIDWQDSRQMLEPTPRLAHSPCPLILCLNRFPSGAEWQDGNRVVFSLAEAGWLGRQNPTLPDRIAAILREYTGPRGLDPLPPTPAAERAALMDEIKSRYNYRVKDIFQGAEVDRSYLNKWKLGQVDDGSEPSYRIENFLRRHRHLRRIEAKSS